MSKTLKIILFVVGGVIILLLAAAFMGYQCFYVYPNSRIDYYNSIPPENIEPADLTMTAEERLADFEKVYEYAVLSNPQTPEYAKLYGIDFEEMYEEYKEYIKEAESPYDYIFTLYAYTQSIPSGHTYIIPPGPNELRVIGFQQNELWGTSKDEDEYMLAWKQILTDTIDQYDLDNTELIGFSYVDGKYVSRYEEGVADFGKILEKIDGKDPLEYTFDPLQVCQIEYDDANQCAYREECIFNNRFGTPVTLTLRDSDGNITEETYYLDEKLTLAKMLDKSYKKKEENGFKDDTIKHYTITEDDANNLVYFRAESCMGNLEELNEELATALEGHDNIIIDLRGNGGGKAVYYSQHLYPVLFSDSKEIETTYELGRNKNTVKWVREPFNKFNSSSKIGPKGILTYCSVEYLYGEATQKYNIYLIQDEGTFSSGDHISSYIAEEENVTLIGTNTGGEGRSGNIFSALLPESHLVMAYTPSYAKDITPMNGVYGTPPDIISPTTAEEIIVKDQLEASGIDSEDYLIRQQWDKTLNKTIQMIKDNK